MFIKVLPGKTKSYLALLKEKKILPKDTYLAGGTAVALQLDHRISYDLDFFTPIKFKSEEVLEDLKKIKDFQLERTDWQTILGSFPDCKFSLFYYQYPLIEPPKDFNGIKVADLKDLVASKIGAISSRGTKRDFIDLFYILKKGKVGNLQECLRFYDLRFKNLASQKFYILKSLTYFEDADQDRDPKMLVNNYSWPEVKKYLIEETQKILEV